jgi:hypothetical protein
MKGNTMNNSLVHSLEGYVAAIFADIGPTYGSKHECERDLSRSLHELAVRGERFLTIDLPAIRKHLEKCLEEGLYTPSGLYLSRQRSKRIIVPAFCADLYLQIFDVDGKLRTEPNVNAIADLRQLYEGFGKLKHPCKQEAIDEEVSNFLKNENELRKPTLDWASDYLTKDDRDVFSIHFCDGLNSHSRINEQGTLPGIAGHVEQPFHGDIATLQRVCDQLSSSFGNFHLERDDEDVSERPKHGAGRVSNQPRVDSKFDFSNWPRKLDLIFPYDRYAVSDLGYATYLDDFSSKQLRSHEEASKLIAVPKTMSGPRLIGSEPNYHQWIQQLIRAQIESRLKNTPLADCISFGDQEPNRMLALSSSIDGSYATVDLKSASDRLSCWAVERALRANLSWLERIHASRTRWMKNAINDHFHAIMLKKCFTQGSACTFPVQTVVYSMYAIAAVLITERKRINSKSIREAARKVRVFGDDIIVPTHVLPKLTEILSFTQLNVNSNKTFSKGKFRESCGLDAYDGVDVTPARVKRFSVNPSHEVAESMIEASNNFYKRGMWHVSQWLRWHLRKVILPIIPLRDSEKTVYDLVGNGYQCVQGASLDHLQKRWNSKLHLYEYKVDQLVSKTKKVPTQSAYDLTEYHFGSRTKVSVKTDHLDPVERDLGIVNKKSSVMRRGWKTMA